MKRIHMTITLFCLSLFMLVGCSKQKSTSDTKQKKVEIKIVYPVSRAMGERKIDEFKEWFEKKYPDAKLNLSSSSISTISDTVKSDFQNHNEPDVFVTTEYDTFVDKKYMADITGMQVLTKFRRSSVRNLERNGKVYALPIGGGNLIGLHYNKKLFDEYHLAYPSTKETLYDVALRVNKVIEKNDLDKNVIGASLLYPLQASAVINSTMAEQTQTAGYLKWIANYYSEDFSFDNPVFQNYIEKLEFMINEKEDEKGNEIPNSGKLFSHDDYYSTQSSSVTSFLNGASFLYVGDVNRVWNTLGTEGNYGKSDIGVMGIPIGMNGIDYVSYMDDLYMGINSEYDKFSARKQQIITEILNYIVDADNETRNIFTFTGDYCSVYLEGESIKRNKDAYFDNINESIEHNYVSQEVSNTPISALFGKIILSWKKEGLESIVKDGTDLERITTILRRYKDDGFDMFAKSEKPIGKSKYLMEYQSNVVRTQETAVANQIADMARDYMKTDFALLNSGGIRASIPKGDVSSQTLNSVLPYENYLVAIKASGATIKQALKNAYNVGPLYKSGQFGAISGLRVTLKTNELGYEMYQKRMDDWKRAHSKAGNVKKNAASKEIVENMCAENMESLNLEVIKVTDDKGNEIQDDKIYSLATLDYLLKGGDGYNMLAILDDKDGKADMSIKVYNKSGVELTGSAKQMTKQMEETCDKSSEAFISWVKEGNVLQSKKDGRIQIKNFIYVE